MDGGQPAGDDTATVGVTADAAAVARLCAGETAALAELYDRWSDRVHSVCARVLDGNRDEAADATQDTFLIAIDKIGQLRDPDRVGPWLLAIARHEAIRRGKRRAKERAVDTTEPTNPITSSADTAVIDDVADVERADVVAVAGDAIASLNAREAALVELHLVQGLEGRDLAAAAGIAHDQLHVALKRMRTRLSDAVTALYIARHGRGDCAGLQMVLDGWDGGFSSVIRKRVARHARDCDTCTDRGRRANPLAAAVLLPIVPAPIELRTRLVSAIVPGADPAAAAVLSPGAGDFGTDAEGFPTAASGGRRRALWVLGAAVVLLLGAVVGVAVWSGDDDGVDLATVGDGEANVDDEVDPTVAEPSQSTTSRDRTPTTVPVTTEAPPQDASPTSSTSTTSTTPGGAVPATPPSTEPTTTTTTTEPPDITAPALGPLTGDSEITETTSPCSGDHVLDLQITATDSAPMTASARLSDSSGNTRSTSLQSVPGGFAGSLGPFADTYGSPVPNEFEVPATLTVRVQDSSGNVSARSRPVTIHVSCLY